jgi:hypothetical protein
MDIFLEILKYALPSIFLLILCYMMLANFMDNEEKRRSYFLKKETQKSALPIRMQAYERITLFLERINPDRLLPRLSSKGMNVQQFHNLLVNTIRMEFEHNLSQQIYISEDAWRMVIRAKSSTVGMINTIAQTLDPKANGIELSKAILNRTMEMETSPTHSAVVYLKSEIKRDF